MDEAIKTTDDYENQRLELLMHAVKNDKLEGELCPNCFELLSIPMLRRLKVQILFPSLIKGEEKGLVEEALYSIRDVKGRSVLKKVSTANGIVNEYVCTQCSRSYIGELDLIANQAETRVLSFFGYDDNKIYKRDFYTFSVLDDSYGPFVEELWNESVSETFDPHSMINDGEDIISGQVLGQLRAFFKKFADEVYKDMGASVQIYSESHANKQELFTGGDFAIWIGPLTKEDAQVLIPDVNGHIDYKKLPAKVGNGVIFQAKKERTGQIDKKQLEDLMHYASISYRGHEYFGVPGKLFMSYSPEPPYVTILSCDYTYALYNGKFMEKQKSVTFPKTLKELAKHATRTQLPEFVQAYLSGRVGTPLLMLRDVFGVDGPKLIIGLPPEMLRNPSLSGKGLASLVGGWHAKLEESIEQMEEAERAAEQLREAEYYGASCASSSQQAEEEYRPAQQDEYEQVQEQEHVVEYEVDYN